MVTRNDVKYAYRLLLGREPENRSVVKAAAAGHKNLKQLRQSFMASPEFAAIATAASGNRFPLDLEQSGLVEVSCDAQSLQKLIARVERIWTRLGEKEPYWSVLTMDAFKKDSFQQNQEVYWSTGQFDTLRFAAWLKRSGIVPRPEWTCLEYGCGTGRVTRWLAKDFQSVIGCDISESHLAAARESLTADVASRVQFVRIESLAALSELPEFDVLFSVIVLQHNPPPLIAYILDKLLGRLRPGGIAYFQVPTFRLGYHFEVAKYLAEPAVDEMEMHVLPQKHLFELAKSHHCDLLEVQPDDKTGSLEYVSNTVLLQKSL
jgi:SAM-dependent methyltransferase